MLRNFEKDLLGAAIGTQDKTKVMEIIEQLYQGDALGKLLGRTPMHSIALMGDIELYDQLTALNIKTDVADHQGETPAQLMNRWKFPQKSREAYLICFTGEEKIIIACSPFIYGREKQSVHYYDPSVNISARHMQIEHANGDYYICDLGSLNGTFLNGRKIEINKQQKLEEDDQIKIYNKPFLFKYSDSPETSVYLTVLDELGQSTGQRIKINKFPFEYGREEGNVSYAVSSPHISRRHMSIQSKLGKYFISDLGSSNGTFVNGHRLLAHESVQLMHGDHIKVYSFNYSFSTEES